MSNTQLLNKPETNDKGHENRLTTFAFVKKGNSINIYTIGCFELFNMPKTTSYIRGTIKIKDFLYPVADPKVLAGGSQREISDESCIVLLNANENLTRFGSAILVDDVTEVLHLAGKT